MTLCKIGNWLITEEGIKWVGQPKVDYTIPKDRLLELRLGSKIYDWLVHLAEKTWVTEADIYTLNTAFIYAIDYFGLDFKTASYVETIKEQQKEIEEKKATITR